MKHEDDDILKRAMDEFHRVFSRIPKQAEAGMSERKKKSKGYYGFPSREAYEAYYRSPESDWEIPLMEAYVRETEEEAKLARPQSNHNEG